MRDALGNFGLIALGTDKTDYCADELYLGTILAAYRRTLHSMGHIKDLWVKFVVTTIWAGGTSIQYRIFSDSTTAPTTVVAAGLTIAMATGAVGYTSFLHLPLEVSNYLRVGAFTVGGMTGAFDASLEFGPYVP